MNCIKCKTKENLTRHHIYPQVFAKLSRTEVCSTVTLCRTCHTRYEKEATKLIQQLYQKHFSSKFGEYPKVLKVFYKNRRHIRKCYQNQNFPSSFNTSVKIIQTIMRDFGKFDEKSYSKIFYQQLHNKLGQRFLITYFNKSFNRFLKRTIRPFQIFCAKTTNKTVILIESSSAKASERFKHHYKNTPFVLTRLSNTGN